MIIIVIILISDCEITEVYGQEMWTQYFFITQFNYHHDLYSYYPNFKNMRIQFNIIF